MHKNKDTYVEAFARGLSVLRSFENERNGLTLTQVAGHSGLSAASARRLLHTLVHLGYARLDDNRFYLTPLVLRLGFSYLSSLPLRDIAQPFINDFAAANHEVCTLAILDGLDVMYIARADVRSPMERGLVIGDRLPAHATSTGHVLLGSLSPAERECYLNQAPFRQFTAETLCERTELQAAIERAKNQGWALASEHVELGVSGLAVPVFDHNHQRIAAALTVSVNLARYTETSMVEKFLKPLQDIAVQIQAAVHTT